MTKTSNKPLSTTRVQIKSCMGIGLWFLTPYFYLSPVQAETIVNISDFANEPLSAWESKSFDGETSYDIMTDADAPVDSPSGATRHILVARSNSSASGLFKRQRIDLQETPYLNWRWRIDKGITNANGSIDETQKSGDDYAARIYVIVDGKLIRINSKAVNYVWSSHQAAGSRWDNAFAPNNAKMLAVRGKDDTTGQWRQEKRHVANDFKLLFNRDVRYIDAVAIMTDTDNTQQQAQAAYADIYFSAD